MDRRFRAAATRARLDRRPNRRGARRSAMADKNIIIGRAINVTGMIGVSAGIVLLAFGIVLLLFRRGLGFDIANPFHWFW
jgi:hypothetical protein